MPCWFGHRQAPAVHDLSNNGGQINKVVGGHHTHRIGQEGTAIEHSVESNGVPNVDGQAGQCVGAGGVGIGDGHLKSAHLAGVVNPSSTRQRQRIIDLTGQADGVIPVEP